MAQYLKLFFNGLIALSLILTFGACSGSEESDVTATLPSEPGDDDPVVEDPVEDTPVGEVEDSGFWVNVQSDQYDVYVDNTTGFDTDCFIDVDEPTNTDMTCHVDIMEGALYVHDVSMQYNAPPGLCDIVVVRPAWKWNQSVGYGPTRVALFEDESTVDEPVLEECYALNENEVDGGSPALLADTNMLTCAANVETNSPVNITTPTCVYDNSPTGGANCCFGNFTFERWEDSNNDGNADTLVESTPSSWGGSVGACISPYIGDGWTLFSDAGYPVSTVTAVPRDPSTDNPTGLNDAVTLTANASSHTLAFSTWSNFYTTSGTPHNHDGYYDATTSNMPYSVEPIDDLSGTAVTSGRDAWMFECRDSAYELKHRINVYIREWNTLADFFVYQTSGGVTYDPDVVGVEGINCDYNSIFGSGSCNDLSDLDDVLTDAGGSYPTPATPGAGDATNRETYFPRM